MNNPVNQHYIPAFFWRRFLDRKNNTSRVYSLESNSYTPGKTTIRKATAVDDLYNIHSFCFDHDSQSPILKSPYKAENILSHIENDVSKLPEISSIYFIALKSLLTFKNPNYLINRAMDFLDPDSELIGTNLSDFFFDFFNAETRNTLDNYSEFHQMEVEGLPESSGGFLISDNPVFLIMIPDVGYFSFIPIRRNKLLVAFQNENVKHWVQSFFSTLSPEHAIMKINESSYKNSINSIYGDKKSIEVFSQQSQNGFK